MNGDDWRTVGYIGIGLAVLFLIAGFLTYAYSQETYFLGTYAGTVYPYRSYSIGLFVAGFAFIVIGGGSTLQSGTETEKNAYFTKPAILYSPQSTQSALKRYCRFCGAENRIDAVFCEKCGKQIS